MMKTPFTVALLSLGLMASTAHASGAEAKCEAQAAEKKLAGAAKNSFVKKCVTDAGTQQRCARSPQPTRSSPARPRTRT
jgi:hypothetical protein